MNAFSRQEIKALKPKTGARWICAWGGASPRSYQYQPVLDATSGRIVAYQAVITSSAAHSTLDEVELCIEEGPAGRSLLLTLSVQDYPVEEHDHRNMLVRILQQHLWRDRDVIVHLKHTHKESWGVMQMYRQLQQAGILTMVDAGVPWDLASINILVDAHIIRFHAAQLPEPVEQLLENSQSLGIHTLLAGIRNKAQAEWAARQGIDWLQVEAAEVELL
jgi:hypothetical protein